MLPQGATPNTSELDASGSRSQALSQSGTRATSMMKRKEMTRSKVLEHFEKFITGDGKDKFNCIYCGWDYYCFAKREVMVALEDHIDTCQKYPHGRSTQVECDCHIASEDQKSVEADTADSWDTHQMFQRKALAYMIIVDNLPFKFVEGEGFINFVSEACPEFCIPSRWTIVKECYRLYLDEKLKLRNILKDNCQGICLTYDMWSSLRGINFMCLMAHFIDNDWKLNKRILSFCPVSSHKGDVIGRTVEKCLLDWGIDKIFTITADNASWNDDAIVYLKEKIENWGSSILQGEIIQMRCIVHIFNLVVVDTLQEMGELVTRVREVVRYVIHCPARLQSFQECVEIEKIQKKKLLRLDVPNRWNSTYLMLDVAQYYEKAFQRLEEKDPYFKIDLQNGDGKGVPTVDDWKTVRRLGTLLKHFYEFILLVSGKLYFTSNTFFEEIITLDLVFEEWLKSDDVEFSAMAKSMKHKYDKYLGDVEKMNVLPYVAVVLDPRRKLQFVEFVLNEVYKGEKGMSMGKKVRETTYSLYEEYKNKPAPQTGQTSEEAQMSKLEQPSNIMRIRFKKYLIETKGRNNISELDRYLNEGEVLDSEDFDILDWWRTNSRRFPILSQMARDVLAVPIYIVSSESAFSTGVHALDAFRSSLTPMIIQVLICAKDWLQKSSHPINVEEDLEELEKIEIELSKILLEPTSSDLKRRAT